MTRRPVHCQDVYDQSDAPCDPEYSEAYDAALIELREWLDYGGVAAAYCGRRDGCAHEISVARREAWAYARPEWHAALNATWEPWIETEEWVVDALRQTGDQAAAAEAVLLYQRQREEAQEYAALLPVARASVRRRLHRAGYHADTIAHAVEWLRTTYAWGATAREWADAAIAAVVGLTYVVRRTPRTGRPAYYRWDGPGTTPVPGPERDATRFHSWALACDMKNAIARDTTRPAGDVRIVEQPAIVRSSRTPTRASAAT